MAFRFRLETLLQLRKRLLELAEGELARLLGELSVARQVLDEKIFQIEKTSEKLRQTVQKGTSALEFQSMRNYLDSLYKEQAALEAKIQSLEAELVRIRKMVSERHKEKELVERLRQRQYVSHLRELQRIEQIEADDLSNIRFARKVNETVSI